MRQRGTLFILAAAALASLITALSLHQELIRERARAGDSQKTRGELGPELEKLKAATAAVEGLSRQTQGLGAELKTKLEALQKDAAQREQSLQALSTQLQTKLGEVSAGLTEIKTQITAPGTGVLARVGTVEARLKERDALLQALSAERDHPADDHRREPDPASPKKDPATERSPAGDRGPARGDAAAKAPGKPAPAVPVVTSVEAAEGSSGIVVLGAGKKLGLEPGHVLSITRDGKPIGRVRVLKVYDDLAGAEVIDTASGETIQVSDRASTGEPAPVEAATKVEPPSSKVPPPPPPLPGGTNGAAGK